MAWPRIAHSAKLLLVPGDPKLAGFSGWDPFRHPGSVCCNVPPVAIAEVLVQRFGRVVFAFEAIALPSNIVPPHITIVKLNLVRRSTFSVRVRAGDRSVLGPNLWDWRAPTAKIISCFGGRRYDCRLKHSLLATRPDAALSPHHTFTPPPTCPPAAATGSAVVLVGLLSAPEARLRAR